MPTLDQRPFYAAAALVFVASAAVTVAWCGSMAQMPGMPMDGGWTMSMTWMRMPGRGWIGTALEFTGMWSVMMMAMMLPALVPMLARYRRAIYPHRRDLDVRTLRVAGGYFAVWAAAGTLAYVPGVALAELAMRVPAVARSAPLAGSIVLLLAGVAQLSAWKRRELACCRETIDCCRPPAPSARAAWRHGVDLARRCLRCCAPLTAGLFVLGIMELRAMALAAVAISLERLAPRGEMFARAIGVILAASGIDGIRSAIE